MTTEAFSVSMEKGKRARKAILTVVSALMIAVGTNTRPARKHIRDHGYTFGGFSFISGASFLHSAFTGLLVTGILLLVFEWKVSDEE